MHPADRRNEISGNTARQATVEFLLFSCQRLGCGLHFSYTLWHARNPSDRGQKLRRSTTCIKAPNNCRPFSLIWRTLDGKVFPTLRGLEPELNCNSVNASSGHSARSPRNIKPIGITNSHLARPRKLKRPSPSSKL